jgi:hypothetical protein
LTFKDCNHGWTQINTDGFTAKAHHSEHRAFHYPISVLAVVKLLCSVQLLCLPDVAKHENRAIFKTVICGFIGAAVITVKVLVE